MSVQGIPRTTTAVATGGQPTQNLTIAAGFPGWGIPQPPRPLGVDAVTDYNARFAVHGIWNNGVEGMANFFRQVLFNPSNADRAAFLNTPERVQWFKNLAIQDLISGIQKYGRPVFTGDSMKEAIRKSYYLATGVDAFRNIGATRTQAFNFHPTSQQDYNSTQQQALDPSKPADARLVNERLGGGLGALIYTLWGHAASVNKVIDNTRLAPFLNNELTNPQARDFGQIQGTPGGANYVRGLLGNNNRGDQINQDFINVIAKLFPSVRA
jgi:hypothetical protein